MTRGPVIALVALLLAGGGFADCQERGDSGGRAPGLEPRAASAGAVSSTWYCTGATAAPGGMADGTVLVANAGSRPLKGTVTLVPLQGDIRGVTIEVPAAGRTGVRIQDTLSAPFASALVELDGGQGVAELAVNGPLGPSVSPCASSASRHWYFAEGATTKDAAEMLSIYNPFPEDAIVDFTFGTEDGRVTPEALSGVVVAGHGMFVVNVGDHVHRRQVVASSVMARVGRIVVSRLETFDGSAGRKGATLALGAPGPSLQWYFPEGLVADGLTERYQLYNPYKREAVVTFEFAVERGEGVEPLELRVPPESRLTVTSNTENRIPKGVPHAVAVRVTGGDGVIAERTVDAGPPSGRLGVAWTLGAVTTSTRWVFAAGGADDATDEWIAVHNPGRTESVFSISILADGQLVPVDGVQGVRLDAGQRLAVRIGDHVRRGATPMLVRASTPVVAERGLYASKGPGTAMGVGIPLR